MKILLILLISYSFASQNWKKYAVILTSNEGLTNDTPLQFSKRDGERIQQTLLEVGGLAKENIFHIHTNNVKTAKKKLQKIGSLFSTKTLDSEKVFLQLYYSGHGSAANFHIGGSPLSLDELRQDLQFANIDTKLIVLDVCYGGTFFSKGFSTAPPIKLNFEMNEQTQGEVLISSSASHEQSFETPALGGSIFTNNWVLALRGAADVNQDGKVSLFESYNYAYEKTLAYSSTKLQRQQHPSFQMDLKGSQDIPLANPNQGKALTLILQDVQKGNYSIRDIGLNTYLGDFKLDQGQIFSLALPKGHYEIIHHPINSNPQAATFSLNHHGVILYPKDLRKVSRSYASSKGFHALNQTSNIKSKHKYFYQITFGPSWSYFTNTRLNRTLKQSIASDWNGALDQTNTNSGFNVRFTFDLSKNISLYLAMNRLESQLNGDFYRDELINTTKINFRETQRLTAKVDEYEFSLGMVYWHLETKYGRGGVQIGFGNYIIGIEGDQKWERELFEMEQDLEIKTKATGYTYSLGVLWQKQFIRHSSVSIPVEFGIICSQSKGHSDIDNDYTNWSSKNTNISTFINIGLAFGSD